LEHQIEILRYLASRELQDRYIVHGTKDEYLIPEELIEDALGFVEEVAAGRRGGQLTETQRSVVNEFGDVLRAKGAAFNAELSAAELVQNDPNWAMIRAAAQRVVAALERN
jgi:hypothetical protein